MQVEKKSLKNLLVKNHLSEAFEIHTVVYYDGDQFFVGTIFLICVNKLKVINSDPNGILQHVEHIA